MDYLTDALAYLRTNKAARRRWSRVVGYSLMALAGVFAIAVPAPSVQEAAESARYLAMVWAIMLVVGGVASAIGAALDRWLGEYAGLWPLITTFLVYAVSIAVTAARNPPAWAGAALLGSIAFLLLSRWRDVAAVRHHALRHTSVHSGR